MVKRHILYIWVIKKFSMIVKYIIIIHNKIFTNKFCFTSRIYKWETLKIKLIIIIMIDKILKLILEKD